MVASPKGEISLNKTDLVAEDLEENDDDPTPVLRKPEKVPSHAEL